MTKDVIEAIEERVSVRNFSPDPIPDATIGRILDAGRRAPSAGNIQPWHFVVIKNPQIKRDLARCSYDQDFIREAPVVIVVCAEPSMSGKRYGDRGNELYCIQDTAAAAQNMLLAATGFGLGSCWVGAFDEQSVQKLLQLGSDKRPVAILPIGLTAEEPIEDSLRSLDEVVRILH